MMSECDLDCPGELPGFKMQASFPFVLVAVAVAGLKFDNFGNGLKFDSFGT